MLSLSLPAAIVAYVVAIFFAALAFGYRSAPARRAATTGFLVAWLLHLVSLVDRAREIGRVPLTDGAEYLLVLGWVVMTLHLVLWLRWRVLAAGLVLPPLAALAAVVALPLLGTAHAETRSSSGGWFLLHTSISTLGMATLVVALAMSAIYLLQDHGLKAHARLVWLERLPSLERSDRLGLRALWIGFGLLTVGIAAGFVINAAVYHRLWVPGPKQTLPLLAWIFVAAALALRVLLGRGRKQAYLTITGVTLGLLTVLGMSL